MANIFKEIKIASFLVQRNMGAAEKFIQNAYDLMTTNIYMNFACKPSDSAILGWYFATHDDDKDIDYFYEKYKNLQQYMVPSVKYITITATVKKPEDVVE